jgi:hypothetical protein
VTLSAHDSGIALLPPDIFDGHYLQCVLARFATDEYKSLHEITEGVRPLKTRDECLEDEWTDNNHDEEDPPYPSHPFD